MRPWRSPAPYSALALTTSALLLHAACGPALHTEGGEARSAAGVAPTPEELPSGAPSPAEDAAPDQSNAAQAEARRGARAWLALVDRHQYAESWQSAAPIFQSSTSQEQWSAAVQRVREPLGDLSARRFRAAELRTNLAGAPEGQYYIVHYDSAFAQKPSAREVVTLKQSDDASWKVAGYFVE